MFLCLRAVPEFFLGVGWKAKTKHLPPHPTPQDKFWNRPNKLCCTFTEQPLSISIYTNCNTNGTCPFHIKKKEENTQQLLANFAIF